MTPFDFIQLVVELFHMIVPGGSSREELAVIGLPLGLIAGAIIAWNYGIEVVLKVVVGFTAPIFGLMCVWMTASIVYRSLVGESLPMPSILGYIYPHAVTFWFVTVGIAFVTVAAVGALFILAVLEVLYPPARPEKQTSTELERQFQAANRITGETSRPSLFNQWLDSIDGYLDYFFDEARLQQQVANARRFKERKQRSS